MFEDRLLHARIIDRKGLDAIQAEAQEEVDAAVAKAVREPKPLPEDVERFVYAPSKVDQVYPGDYTGLP
jgi:2-oxoisovalerate dehydrogenase E1 component alpha subunit